MELKSVAIAIPEGANLILGQTHFIKTCDQAMSGSLYDLLRDC